MLLLGLVKTEKERRKANEEAAENVERNTHTHKSWYFKYRNNDWKGERAGRYDGAKECTVDILKTEWKGVKRGTLEVAASYSTTELMEEKMSWE